MRYATVRTPVGTRAARVEGAMFVGLAALDVGELLRAPDATEITETGERWSAAEVSPAPVVVRPGKIVCVGLNYRHHILEMGREVPDYPTLFAKYPEALVGAEDDIVLPPESEAVDWEAELALVIGSRVRRADTAAAEAAIAGFSVLNDVTMRDWQYRSPMWLQGKTWEATTPFGPYLVTPDELPGGPRPTLELSGAVDGEVVQHASTADLVFDPVDLVQYVSTLMTLEPGDVIATGTPGGVGHARKPPRYLTDGAVLTTRVEHLGQTRNVARVEQVGAG